MNKDLNRMLELAGIVSEGDDTKLGQDGDIDYSYDNFAFRNNYLDASEKASSKELVLKSPIKNILDSNSDEFEDVMDEYDHIKQEGVTPIIYKIDINRLIGSEKWLNMHNINGGHTNNKRPVVLKYVNKYYIIDGNHRVAKSLLKGEQYVIVDLYDWDSHTQNWKDGILNGKPSSTDVP